MSQREPDNYLVYWKWSAFELNNGRDDYDPEGNQIRRKKPGDRLFVCSVLGNELYIGGVFQISKVAPTTRRNSWGSSEAHGYSISGPFFPLALGAVKWKL